MSAELRLVMQKVKEKRLYVSGSYGTYLGKEFMDSQKIMQLTDIVREGRAANVSEAIAVYEAGRQQSQPGR